MYIDKRDYNHKLKIKAIKSKYYLSPKGLSYAWASKLKSGKILDYGCREGDFAFSLEKLKKFSSIYGIDLDGDALNKAKLKDTNKFIKWIQIKKNKKIPLEDSSVDNVIMTEVLEHIHNKKFILDEINRILVKNGQAFITVPGLHTFSFLDMGNFKFIFPKIHKFFYVLRYDLQKYNYRYVNNPYGLVGDIEREAAWHKHFSLEEFKKMAQLSGFQLIYSGGIGFFFRLFINLEYFFPKFLKKPINKLIEIDNLLFNRAQIYFIIKKI